MSLESADSQMATGEVKALIGIQHTLTHRPGVLPVARALSHFGEHSLGWLAVSAAGAIMTRKDPYRRSRWIDVGVGAFGAHALSVIVKRIVRRRRPHHPEIAVGVGTPSKLSFPSSHATSTAAAAILIDRAAGLPAGVAPAILIPPMLASRLVLGVHYPTDVAGGALVGAASAAALIGADKIVRRRLGSRWPFLTGLISVGRQQMSRRSEEV